MGGTRKPILRGKAADLVRELLASKPDWTVRALAGELKVRGVEVSPDSVWRFLRREGLSFKKNPGGQRTAPPEGGEVPRSLEDASAPA